MRKYVRNLIEGGTTTEATDTEAASEVERLHGELESLRSRGKMNEVKLDTLHRILHKIGIAYTKGRFGKQDVGSLLDEALTYVFKEKDDCPYDSLTPASGANTQPVRPGEGHQVSMTMTPEGPMPLAGTLGG